MTTLAGRENAFRRLAKSKFRSRFHLSAGDTSMLKEIPISEAQITSKTPSEDFRFASAVAEFALLAPPAPQTPPAPAGNRPVEGDL